MSQDGDNIYVCCRARPYNNRERVAKATDVVILRPESNSVELPATHGKASKPFTFDRVFAHDATQEEVFANVAVPVMKACLAGYNGTIFAYGQTGSGKTYTVMGPSAPHAAAATATGALALAAPTPQCGLLPRILHYVFDELDALALQKPANAQFSYSTRCSYLEIYNEHIFDLSHGTTGFHGGGGGGGGRAGTPKSLSLRESAASGVYVEGIQELTVECAADALAFVHKGNHSRHVSATNMNRESSRSHSVFSLCVESTEYTPDGLEKKKSSKFHLIDLAGSERIKQTKAVGSQVTEAKNINKSLSALGNVIKALSEIVGGGGGGGRGGGGGASRHVPYRDSKLTFLLRDSLGGNSRTSIIATVSTASVCVSETHSTLGFARRAKNVKNRPVINEAVGGTVLELQGEILRLRRELLRAQAVSATTLATPPQSRTRQLDLGRGSSQTREAVEDDKASGQQQPQKQERVEEDAAEATAAAAAAAAAVDPTDALLLEDAYRLRRQVLSELQQERRKCAAMQNKLQSTKMILRLRDADRHLRNSDAGDGVAGGTSDQDAAMRALHEEIALLRQQVQMPPEAVVWRQRHEQAEARLRQCSDAASTIATLEATRDALVGKLEAQFTRAQGLAAGHTALEAVVQRLEREAMASQDYEARLLQRDLPRAAAAHARVQVEVETAALQRANRTLQGENLDMEGRCATMAKHLRQAEAQARQLHAQHAQAAAEKQQFKSALMEAMRSIEQLKQQQKQQQQQQTQQQHQDGGDTASGVCSPKQQQQQQLQQQELEAATRQIRSLQQAESEQRHAREQEAEAAAQSAKIDRARLEAELTMRRALLQNATQQREQLAGVVAQQKTALAAAAARVQQLEQAAAAAQEQKEQQQQQHATAAAAEARAAKAAVAAAATQAAAVEETRQRVEAEWARRHAEAEDRAMRAEAATAEARASCAELRAQFEQVKEWRGAMQDAGETVLQLQEDKRALAKDLEKAYAAAAASSSETHGAMQRVKQAQAETAALAKKVDEMARWKASVTAAVAEAKAASKQKERELAQARKQVAQLQQLQAAATPAEPQSSAVDEMRAEAQRMQLAHKAELHGLAERLGAAEAAHAEEKHRADQLLADNAKLAGHANQKQKIRHLEKLAEEKNHLREQVAVMQAERDQLRSQNRRLLAEVSKAHSHVENTGAAGGATATATRSRRSGGALGHRTSGKAVTPPAEAESHARTAPIRMI